MTDPIDQGGWGVCGFVSVLNGLRRGGLLPRLPDSRELSLEDIQVRLYAEILAYLKHLRFVNSPIVTEIREITDSCRPIEERVKSFDEIIQLMESRLRQLEVANKGKGNASIRKDMVDLIHVTELTIAMSPAAIVDYMKWAGVRGAQYTIPRSINCTSDHLILFKGCVIGIGGAPTPNQKYNGLAHWIYVDRDGSMDNWGERTRLVPGKLGTDLFGSWATHITHVIQLRP